MRKRLLYLMILLSVPPYSLAADTSIRLGLFPYANPAKLIEHHKSFVKHLETSTGYRIQILTSADYQSFLQRTHENEFDIILTAPHFGRLAESRDGYQRIAMTKHNVQGVYMVKSDSGIQNISELKAKRLTIAAPSSIVYRLAEHQLREEYGLVNGKDIEIIPTGNHNNAIYAVIRGESEAAVTGINLYYGFIKARGPIVRKIGETKKLPGFMFMANSKVSVQMVQLFKNAALDFAATDAGKTYVFHGYQEIRDKTMQKLDAYTDNL